MKHDVIAFLTHVEELAGIEARWLHRGMTSSDVLDSSLAILLRDAADAAHRARRPPARRARDARAGAREDADDRAEPRHLRRAGHVRARARGAPRRDGARPRAPRGGARGDCRREDRGRGRDVRAPVARDRGAGARARSASDPRRSRRRSSRATGTPRTSPRSPSSRPASSASRRTCATGNGARWARPRRRSPSGQKGSSAMPHKRNPILSENLCGLARIVRAAVVPALEDVALWHERDISHSSVERMIGPDATATLGFMLDARGALVDGLVVYADNLRAKPRPRRRALLLRGGAPRARRRGAAPAGGVRLVQKNAMRAWSGDGTFRAHSKDDESRRSATVTRPIACFTTVLSINTMPDPRIAAVRIQVPFFAAGW